MCKEPENEFVGAQATCGRRPVIDAAMPRVINGRPGRDEIDILIYSQKNVTLRFNLLAAFKFSIKLWLFFKQTIEI